MTQLLYDDEVLIPQILEDDSSKNRLVIGGVFQRAEVPNANGRIYPRPLWEKLLNNNKIQEAIKARRMLGLIEHPSDGKTDPTKASHIVTELKLNENNEIIGRAEILNTPNGLILQELFRAGCQLGISSRGTGTLSKSPKGDMVNEDFNLQTFDIVLTPSTPMAYPKPLSESTENTKELAEMTAHDKYLDFEQRAQTIIEADVSNNAGKKIVENAATKLLIELSEASIQDPSLKELLIPLIEQLNDKRRELRKPLSEETQGDADHGFIRTIPVYPPPPPGEGWPLDPNDAGPATGLGDNVNPWMQQDQMQESALNEEYCPKCKHDPCVCKEKEEEGEEANESANNEGDMLVESQEDFMLNFAAKVVELPESAENAPFRALAAAYLLEHDTRINESEGYNRVLEKIQEKVAEAAETGKLVLESSDEVLEQKYGVALHIIEELKNRLKLLSAKVYAEQQLESVGLKGDKKARQVVAEAIKNDASKSSIDEAIAVLVPVKGLKAVNKTPDTGAITESVTKVESVVNSLTESTKTSKGMDVGAMVSRLSRNVHSRPLV